MTDRFDEMSKHFAGKHSRRGLFRLLGAGFLGAALAGTFSRGADAGDPQAEKFPFFNGAFPIFNGTLPIFNGTLPNFNFNLPNFNFNLPQFNHTYPYPRPPVWNGNFPIFNGIFPPH